MAPKETDPPVAEQTARPAASSASVTVECIAPVAAPERPQAKTDHQGGELGARLAGHWRRREWNEFWGIVGNELRDRIAPSLVCRGLTEEDADDCIVLAQEKLMKVQEKRHADILNPYGCIWTAAHRAGSDLITEKRLGERVAKDHYDFTGRARQKKLEQDAKESEEPEDSDDFEIPDDVAVAVTESLLDDVETNAQIAKLVLKVALKRLRPALARVAKHLLKYGTQCESAEALADLNMKPGTYRPNRFKAIAKLKEIVPQVLKELGISLKFITPPDVFNESPPFPSGEDGDE